jgi:LacI family transcriptional regulator
MARHNHTPATHPRAANCDVGIVMEASTSFSRGVLTGISKWMSQHEGWWITIDDRDRDAPIPQWLLRWAGDGLISGLNEPALPRSWRGGLRPVVHVRSRLMAERLPGVYPDDDAAVQLVVGHFVDRGVRQLAFWPSAADGSSGPCDSILHHAERFGCVVDVFAPPRSAARLRAGVDQERQALARWLVSLPKPVGVMAASDVQAVQLIDTCREHGLAVPDEVAVVGISDDDVLCKLATPALTSVTHDRVRIGLEAAQMLDDLMRAGRPASAVVLVPPVGISIRRSSDVLAVADADIRQALRLIKAKGCADLSAAQVALTVGVPRRLLDRKFQRALGRTIHDELQHTKLNEAKRLLVQTDHKLMVVSVRAGFAHAAQLCNVFKSVFGVSPMQYRKAARPCREIADKATSPPRR